jgi:hypothetical protein
MAVGAALAAARAVLLAGVELLRRQVGGRQSRVQKYA